MSFALPGGYLLSLSTQQLILILVGLGAFIVIAVAIRFSYKKIYIKEFQVGLLYRMGRYKKILHPGLNRIWRFGSEVTLVDTRSEILVIPVQEILTIDPINLKVSVVLTHQIEKPSLAIHSVRDLTQAIYLKSQLVLRNVVSELRMEDVLQKRVEIEEKMLRLLQGEMTEHGVKIQSIRIRDIILPTDLKKAHTEVIRAQKEGQVALERARGESAALRNLANAARMLDNNPSLLYLRVLQSLSPKPGTVGNTLVWGVPTDGVNIVNTPKESGPIDKE